MPMLWGLPEYVWPIILVAAGIINFVTIVVICILMVLRDKRPK